MQDSEKVVRFFIEFSHFHQVKINQAASFFVCAIAIVVVLVFGKDLLIQFIFALLFWFSVRQINLQFDKLPAIKKGVPNWVKNTITSLIIFAVFGLISMVITKSINTLSKSYQKYEANVGSLVHNVNDAFGIDIMELAKGQLGDLDFGSLLSAVFNSLSDILGSVFMVMIYALFIFLEEASAMTKLRKAFQKPESFAQVSELLTRIEKSVRTYLGLKTLVSLITGVCSYAALAIIGIDSPVFWAFLIFILNFIPTIGSLVGTLFPAIFCLLQFGDLTEGGLVLLIVGAIQLVVGNVLEPKMMGDSMNISALVTILALSFWGAIWGVTGMILSVPITVIILIICAQFESSKRIAILLSQNGEVG